MRWPPLVVAVALAAGCAGGPTGSRPEDCSAAAIWQVTAAGGTTACEATSDDQRSAMFLGERHAELAERLAVYEAAAAAGGLTGPQQLERVDILRDIEQIQGVAIVRGWVPADPGLR